MNYQLFNKNKIFKLKYRQILEFITSFKGDNNSSVNNFETCSNLKRSMYELI